MDLVFDKWIQKRYPDIQFERYADDIVVHCNHLPHANRLLEEIERRFKECKLEVNQEKTRIVYCRRNQEEKTKV